MTAPAVPQPTDLQFDSGDASCHAWLYLPEGADARRPGPAVVMAHGLGATKTQGLGEVAGRLRAAGYVVLVFDHRHLGRSAGRPRDLIEIAAQLEDWRSAVVRIRRIEYVDPDAVALWGTSFSAGHAICTAADDPAIGAVVAQVPFTSGIAGAAGAPPLTAIRLTLAAFADLRAARRSRPPVRVPLVGGPGEVAVLTAAEALPGLAALSAAAGEELTTPRVPARIVLEILGYSPARRLARVRAPILFCVGRHDTIAPPGRVRRHARRAADAELRTYDCDHFGIHLGEALDRATADQVAFLRRHVPVPGPPDGPG